MTTLFPSSYCRRTRCRPFSLTMEIHNGKRRRQAKEKLQAQCRRKVRLLDAPDDYGLSNKIRTPSPSHRPLQLNCRKLTFIIYLFTAIGLLPAGSGYFTCKQNMKLVTTRFKSGGLHEKHVVATWNVGNHLSICL